MPNELEANIDKFIFKVATDRYYTAEGVWIIYGERRARVGLSDFLQQRSGDVAFAEVKAAGTRLAMGAELAVIETIKVDVSLGCPVGGVVVAINPLVEKTPEVINHDPYGEGWLAELEPLDWDADRRALLEAEAYFGLMKRQAEEETTRS
jgi:glycine cleavage system H protein